MRKVIALLSTILWLLSLSVLCTALDTVQLYDHSTTLAAAIATTVTENGTQLLMQISAPVSYGWAAIGSDHKMDKSIMFIISPSADGQTVTLSLRSTTQHYPPTILPPDSINAQVVSSSIASGRMTANIFWQDTDTSMGSNLSHKTPIDVLNPKQPFIWAVGPSQVFTSHSYDTQLEKHSDHGVVFVDMQASQNPPQDMHPPSIEGTANIGVKQQPHYYNKFILVHTILLTSAFVLVFPFGVIGLRLNLRNTGFTIHWVLQCLACAAMVPGLAIAIAMSILGVRFNHFSQPHQLLGLGVCALVPVQAYLGRSHAIRFKVHNKRTAFTYVHFALGRLVIWGGTVAAILGLILRGRGFPVVACSVIGIVLALVQEFITLHAFLKSRSKAALDERVKGYDMGARYSKLKDVTVTEQAVEAGGDRETHLQGQAGSKQKRKHGW